MEEIKFTALEQERYDIIRSCIDKDITNKEASVRLGLNKRQIQNIKRAVEKDGMSGAVHKSKGRTPPNATSDDTIKKVNTFGLKTEKKNVYSLPSMTPPERSQERSLKTMKESLLSSASGWPT